MVKSPSTALAKSFKVSPTATIRRDLSDLERQGLLRRNHGGAGPVAPMLYEPSRHLSSFRGTGGEARG